ncbi:unnamed protein product [Caenorhabditis bovis]|uniref:Uncharacterized protein n=1 Tax=Caenorhabditis bovis TaxID=2654633 RepID=A0A8S1EA69_9PELO|nr:unnamed protein product [Caenorhabditis bovis]
MYNLVRNLKKVYFDDIDEKPIHTKSLIIYSNEIAKASLIGALQRIAQFGELRNTLRAIIVTSASLFIIICYIVVNRHLIFHENAKIHRFYYAEYIYIPCLVISFAILILIHAMMCVALQNFRITIQLLGETAQIVIHRFLNTLNTFLSELECVAPIYGAENGLRHTRADFEPVVHRTEIPWKMFKKQLTFLEIYFHLSVTVPVCVQLPILLVTIACFVFTGIKTERKCLCHSSHRHVAYDNHEIDANFSGYRIPANVFPYRLYTILQVYVDFCGVAGTTIKTCIRLQFTIHD